MKNIMIVDDEEDIRSSIKTILWQQRYNVIEAGSGNKAQELLKLTPVDAIITDIAMPDGNGLELVDHIKENYPDAKVILVTSYGSILPDESAVKKADAIVEKPFKKEELLKTLTSISRE